jgi:hypothetical protein
MMAKVTIEHGLLDKARRERKFLPCGCLADHCHCKKFNSLGKKFIEKFEEDKYPPPDHVFVELFTQTGRYYLFQDHAFQFLKEGKVLKIMRKGFRLINTYQMDDDVWNAVDMAKKYRRKP